MATSGGYLHFTFTFHPTQAFAETYWHAGLESGAVASLPGPQSPCVWTSLYESVTDRVFS